MGTPILEFSGAHACFSNFHPAKFTWEGIEWPTSENAYQAAKFPRERWDEFALMTPGQSKREGQKPGMRQDWNDVKVTFMLQIVREKFKQNPGLLLQLRQTGTRHLEEGNTWGDRFWGVSPPGSGNGQNFLGKVLMNIRKEFFPELDSTKSQVIINYDFAPK